MHPYIEIVGYRDPDGDTELSLFVDGIEASAYVVMVDPGRGSCSPGEWDARRADELKNVSPAAAEQINEFYDQGRETEFVRDGGR